ncbi:MAG: Cytochrome c biogenesis factor [Bacteroidetes bacterium HLUCCA01]|nr:MAG: Cytochrome c biogenesis factor [Bacteroidetes bacterium HLUCCA01]
MALSNRAKQYIRKNRSAGARNLAKKLNADLLEVQQVLDEQPASTETEISNPGYNRIFTVFALLIPLVFFVLLEAGLRVGNYRGNTDLFIPLHETDDRYTITNPNFAARYFFYTTVIPNPPLEPFLTEKPENGYRVFVMGESSAAGYPYGFNGVPGRVVQDALRDILPDRHVEVITVATSAINSYTLYDQVDEILDHQPDAILIYTGHNEFYGALGAGSNESLGSFPAFVRFYLRVQRLKTFLLLRDQITGIAKWIATRTAPADQGLSTLMQQVVRDQAITLDSPVYELGKIQFESNMNQILNKFEKAGVPVLLGSLVSNLKDHTPFESVQTDSLPGARDVFDQARQRYDEGDFDTARLAFEQARDLDALKFRATSDFNTIIRTLSDRDGVYYVPVEEHFETIAENGIIGFDLMLEHLHPNDTGYFELAWTFYEVLRDKLSATGAPDLSAERDKNAYFEAMHLTQLDHFMVRHRLHVLTRSWPFVREPRRDIYRDYIFEGFIDSLAFDVARNNKRWDEAKVELGDYYLMRGELDSMLAEYRGLMRDQPFNDSPFLIAAQQLLDRNRLDEAYPYLLHAHEISPSAFTYKMLGAIYVDRRDFESGIVFLEESLKLAPSDAQALFNLSGAYAQSGELEKALDLADELIAINPSFPGAQAWKSQLESILNR